MPSLEQARQITAELERRRAARSVRWIVIRQFCYDLFANPTPAYMRRIFALLWAILGVVALCTGRNNEAFLILVIVCCQLTLGDQAAQRSK